MSLYTLNDRMVNITTATRGREGELDDGMTVSLRAAPPWDRFESRGAQVEWSLPRRLR
jgi:hypothetical protein